MSEQQAPAPSGGAPQDPPHTPPDGVPDEAWTALGDPGKRAITAEREAREAAEKSAAALKAQLDEIEKANLSEVERAKREAEEAKTAAATAQSEALRARIQARHSISDEDAELFLTGSDEATLNRQAERLAQHAADRKKIGNRAPLQGRTPDQKPGKDDAKREWLASLRSD